MFVAGAGPTRCLFRHNKCLGHKNNSAYLCYPWPNWPSGNFSRCFNADFDKAVGPLGASNTDTAVFMYQTDLREAKIPCRWAISFYNANTAIAALSCRSKGPNTSHRLSTRTACTLLGRQTEAWLWSYDTPFSVGRHEMLLLYHKEYWNLKKNKTVLVFEDSRAFSSLDRRGSFIQNTSVFIISNSSRS